jgi:hypothetical protein
MCELRVLTAVIACPECKTEVEGCWAEPAEGDEDVEPCLQMCGSCGATWMDEWPGYSFRTEAG